MGQARHTENAFRSVKNDLIGTSESHLTCEQGALTLIVDAWHIAEEQCIQTCVE